MDLGPSPPNYTKLYLKILCMTISRNWPSFMTNWFKNVFLNYTYIKKYFLKYSSRRPNVWSWWMVQNMKNWISQERDMALPWNKKDIKLWIEDYIFRSYGILGEVTFKIIQENGKFVTIISKTHFYKRVHSFWKKNSTALDKSDIVCLLTYRCFSICSEWTKFRIVFKRDLRKKCLSCFVHK